MTTAPCPAHEPDDPSCGEFDVCPPGPRIFTRARQEQGFRSQAHLDAFYRSLDHVAGCEECQKPGPPFELADGSLQPTVNRCSEENRLFERARAENFDREEPVERDAPRGMCAAHPGEHTHTDECVRFMSKAFMEDLGRLGDAGRP